MLHAWIQNEELHVVLMLQSITYGTYIRVVLIYTDKHFVICFYLIPSYRILPS